MTTDEAPVQELQEKPSSASAQRTPDEDTQSDANGPDGPSPTQPTPALEGRREERRDVTREGSGAFAVGERMLDVPLRALMLLVGFALVFDRAFMPSFRGMFVGFDRATNVLRLGASMVSQLAAIASTMTALGVLFAILARRLSGPAKAAAVVGISASMLQATLAMGADRPDWRVMSLAGLAISTFVATSARVAIPLAAIRKQGIVAAVTAFAALAHVTGAVLADLRGSRPFDSVTNPPQVLSTIAIVLEIVAVVVAVAWLFGVQGGRVRVAVALGIAVTATWMALPSDDAGPLRLLVRHGSRALLPSPTSLLPPVVVIGATLAGLTVAFAALTVRGVLPTAAISLGGLLLGRSFVDVPLLGLTVALASGALLLLSSEPRVVWASLPPVRSRPAPPDEVGSASAASAPVASVLVERESAGPPP